MVRLGCMSNSPLVYKQKIQLHGIYTTFRSRDKGQNNKSLPDEHFETIASKIGPFLPV